MAVWLDITLYMGWNKMEDYQERVIAERKELGEKIQKLTAFITSDKILTVKGDELHLLRKQLEAMLEYDRVLAMRVLDFRGPEIGSSGDVCPGTTPVATGTIARTRPAHTTSEEVCDQLAHAAHAACNAGIHYNHKPGECANYQSGDHSAEESFVLI